MVLVFWGVHQPRRVGVLWAFLFGLVMDVHDGALLGQHALAYSLLSFGAISLHRRLPWFNLFEQALQVFPLFVLSHVVAAAVRADGGRHVAGLVGPDGACAGGRAVAACQRCCCWPRSAVRRIATRTDRCDPLNPDPCRFSERPPGLWHFRLRLVAAAGFVLFCFGLLVARLVWLQVVQHEALPSGPRSNRIAVVPIVPNRG